MSNGVSSPEEVQDRPHTLHDRVVHVHLLTDVTMGLCAACVGHVLLRRYDSPHSFIIKKKTLYKKHPDWLDQKSWFNPSQPSVFPHIVLNLSGSEVTDLS